MEMLANVHLCTIILVYVHVRFHPSTYTQSLLGIQLSHFSFSLHPSL